jgi:hypothetical protein
MSAHKKSGDWIWLFAIGFGVWALSQNHTAAAAPAAADQMPSTMGPAAARFGIPAPVSAAAIPPQPGVVSDGSGNVVRAFPGIPGGAGGFYSAPKITVTDQPGGSGDGGSGDGSSSGDGGGGGGSTVVISHPAFMY